MNQYLAPWELEGDALDRLSDDQLRDLMEELIKSEALTCQMKVADIVIGDQIKATDDGCDGKTPTSDGSSDYLPAEVTCWQFKAGQNGTPSKLKGEVLKKIPRETLKGGGVYIVIANTSPGEKGEKLRLAVLKKEAKKTRIPVGKIRVYGREKLVGWCNRFMAITAQYLGLRLTFRTSQMLLGTQQFSGEYISTAALDEKLSALVQRGGAFDRSAFHTHIFGHLGVGKTRFVLEASKRSTWGPVTMWFVSRDISEVTKIFAGLSHRTGCRAVVVVDECDQEQIKALHDAVAVCSSNVHLITIGKEKPPANLLEEIALIEVSPLDSDGLKKYLQAKYPLMPSEHIAIVQEFSSGYVKLAELFAAALIKNPGIQHAMQLYGLQDMQSIMGPLMPSPDDVKNLHPFALFDGLGFEGSKEEEGVTVAKLLGLNWHEVKKTVQRIDHRFGIVPPAGELRYISPEPLAIYLAVDALGANPDDIYEKLIAAFSDKKPVLMSLLNRMRQTASHPHAEAACKKILGDFLSLSDFNNPIKARVWRQLNVADPINAATNLERLLFSASQDERLALSGDARRELIWGLESLVRDPGAFQSAIKSLAHLAIAENETWANNATGDFISHFQFYLGGTSVPYLNRLAVLDNLMDLGKDYRILAIKALAVAANRQFSRMGTNDLGPRIAGDDWMPKSGKEEVDCVRGAMTRIATLVESGEDGLGDELAEAVSDLYLSFYRSFLHDEMRKIIDRFIDKYPNKVEIVRKHVQQQMRACRLRKEENKPEYQKLVDTHRALAGDDMTERVRTYVGPWTIDIEKSDKSEIKKLAKEFLQDLTLIDRYFDWLVSGEANNVWDFARLLGRQDIKDQVFANLWSRRGLMTSKDIRLLVGYLDGASERKGGKWLEKLLDTLDVKKETDANALLQIVWRLLPNKKGAEHVIGLLNGSTLPLQTYGVLAYGGWSTKVALDGFKQIVQKLSGDSKSRPLAISLMGQRISDNRKLLEDTDIRDLALVLTVDPDLITERRGGSYVYDWESLAEHFIDSDTEKIVAAMISAHDNKRGWFIEHSSAGNVLDKCAEKHPNIVWRVLAEKLETNKGATLFAIGFSSGVFEKLPKDKIVDWCRIDPSERAALIAHMTGADFGDDTSLFSRIADQFGKNDSVSSSLSASLHTRGWSGSEAEMWRKLAEQLKQAMENTKLLGLKDWIARELPTIEDAVRRATKKEEERRLRGYS